MNDLVHPILPGFSTTNTALYEVLCQRARELAVIHQRASDDPTGADFAQARLELSQPESLPNAG